MEPRKIPVRSTETDVEKIDDSNSYLVETTIVKTPMSNVQLEKVLQNRINAKTKNAQTIKDKTADDVENLQTLISQVKGE